MVAGGAWEYGRGLPFFATVDEQTTPPRFSVTGILRRVWRLLTPAERRRTGVLLLGIMVNSIIDIGGLTVVIPVIGLVINPDLIHENAVLSTVYSWGSGVGINTEQRFLVAMSIGLILAFAFKALFNFALNLTQTRFSFGIGHRISGEMWRHHFSKDLAGMRATPSGRVFEEINRWPLTFGSMFIVGNLRALNEFLVVVIIVLGLLWYQPAVLVGVGLIILTGAWLIQFATRKRLAYYSETARTIEPSAQTLINGAIQGFIEVLSFQASGAIARKFLDQTRLLYLTTGNGQVLNQTPAKLYEVLAVTGISVAILISIWSGDSDEEFLNLLVLMALSAYRIMPSMTKINAHIINLRAKYHLINVIEAALLAERDAPPEPALTALDWPKVSIELKGVTLTHEGLETPVIRNLSTRFDHGGMHAIVGPSGSGKTTLIHALLGLHPVHSGEVLITHPGGSRLDMVRDLTLGGWISNVGYLSQHPFLFEGTLEENLTMGIEGDGVDEVEVAALIRKLDLTALLGERPLDFAVLEGGQNLSGGQQQTIALLRVLRLNRPILILDEATSALDEGKRDLVFDVLRERAEAGATVILITHDLQLAQRCDTVLDLADGGTSPSDQED